MLFHIHHNVLKVQRWNVSGAIWIFAFKCFHCMLLVEIVQQLRKFRIIDCSLLFLWNTTTTRTTKTSNIFNEIQSRSVCVWSKDIQYAKRLQFSLKQLKKNYNNNNTTHFAKVSLHKLSVQMEWNFRMQIGFLNHLTEFIVVDCAVSICIEQLECRLIECVRCT